MDGIAQWFQSLSFHNISEWMSATYHNGAALWQASLVVLLVTLFYIFERWLYARLLPRTEKTSIFWDECAVRAAHRPAVGLILLLGLTALCDIVFAAYPGATLLQKTPLLREVGFVVLLIWGAVDFISRAEGHLVRRRRSKSADVSTINAMSKVLRATIIILASLVVMDSLGVNVSAVIAFGGMGGIAVGFAAKDLLSNFFGGMMIFMDRPFAVGDWIRSPDRNIEGVVEFIGWRLTHIRTFDKRPLYVPNGIFSTISIENPSRMTNRRIKTLIGVRYDDASKVAQITSDVEDMLRGHEDIAQHLTIFVKLVNFGPSSLDFQVYCFTKTKDWITFQGVQEDVFLKIIGIIEGHGAECAFPTTTLHVPEGIQTSENLQ